MNTKPKAPMPKMGDEEPTVLRPPDSVTVDGRKPVLWTADGKVLTRRIGF